jgi:signal transduction histidine kinase
MNTISGQVLNFLVTPPGSLVYHLVLVFSIAASFQAILFARPHTQYPYTRRILLSLYVLLGGQIILLFLSLLSLTGAAAPRFYLPPLERAVCLLSLLSIIWVWTFERPHRLADLGALAASGIVLVYFVVTLLVWRNESTVYTFNFTTIELTWTILTLLVSVAGIALVFLRRPADWAFGMAIMGLFFLGHLLHLTWGSLDVDFAGPVRLAQLCAFPLLPFLAQRILTSTGFNPNSTASSQANLLRYTAEARTIYAWLQSIFPDSPEKVGATIARAIALTMNADVCYLVSTPTQSGDVNIQVGFDLTHGVELSGLVIPEADIPSLGDSLRQGQPTTIKGNAPDLKTLNTATGFKASSLLMIPLNTSQQVWGGAILLSPFSNRNWDIRDQSYLAIISEYIVRILYGGGLLTPLEITPVSLESTSESTSNGPPSLMAQAPSSDTLSLEKQAAIDKESLESFRLQAEETIANLQSEVLQLHTEIAARDQISAVPEDAEEVVGEQVNQMHNPLISAQGYTELLLSESIGILGSLQRSALEHIRTTIAHMRGLHEEINNYPVEPGFAFRTAGIGDIIDEAIADTGALRREKNISLRVDLPDTIPQAEIDREVMQQILVELLQNAGAATPAKGSIGLHVHHENLEDNNSCLVFQVTDSGGGIDSKTLASLFRGRGKSQSTPIKGIGSITNIEIASTLVETYCGEISAKSVRGKSTTFTVRLPIQQNIKHPSAL